MKKVGSHFLDRIDDPSHPRQAVKIKSPKITRKFHAHYRKWCACTACPLHQNARFHVIGAGRLPVDVLFVSEAPGAIENSIGKPLTGADGRIFGLLLKELESKLKRSFTYAITNVVACKPFAADAAIVAPPKESIEACRPRLEEFIEMANPCVIICLGKVAFEAFSKVKNTLIPIETIWKPSYLSSCGGPSSLEFRKTVLNLKTILGKAIG